MTAFLGPGAIASLFLGAAVDRYGPGWVGRRRPFVVASFVVYGSGAWLVPAAARAGALPLLAVVAGMGIGCAMFFPATLAIPPSLVPERLLGAAYGLLFTAQAAGMTVGPLALGVVFDRASGPAGFVVIGALAALGAAGAFRWRAP